MNCSADGYGPVDVDALMTTHHEKMQHQIMMASNKNKSDCDESTKKKVSFVNS